ncbi:MAG: hypothetical protein F6K55_03970 [Moorea sp. SIO4A3]|nr:hypothetical protein [Moorena sp. SIO4A3]
MQQGNRGGSAVLGRQRLHAGVPPTRALPWSPPLALCRGFPHSRLGSRPGGYNLENTKVNERRLQAIVLLISIAYTLATLLRRSLQNLGVSEYICRPGDETLGSGALLQKF